MKLVDQENEDKAIAERKGEYVLKKENSIKPSKKNAKFAEDNDVHLGMEDLIKNEKQLLYDSKIPNDLQDPGFETTDLAVYIRWLITSYKGSRKLNIFERRLAMLNQIDGEQLIKDYKLLANIQPGKQLLEIIDDFEGVNM